MGGPGGHGQAAAIHENSIIVRKGIIPQYQITAQHTAASDREAVTAPNVADEHRAAIAPNRPDTVDNHRIGRRVRLAANLPVTIVGQPPVTDQQAVGRAKITNVQIAANTPGRACATYQNTVARAVLADIGVSAISHLGSVADHQPVTRAIVAEVKVASITPHRTRARNHHTVIAPGRGYPHKHGGTNHLPAAVDRQAVGITKPTEVHRAPSPDRAGASDHNAVAVARHAAVVHVTVVAVNQLTAVADHQAIARAVDADDERIVPNRARISDQHAVVAAAGSVAQITVRIGVLVDHLATVADHQTVAGARVAKVEVTTVTPNRAAAGDHHAIVATAGFIAHVCIPIGQH